jgi:MEDS: MEthanogen/methylotroph, DcmR Sensory domain
LNDACDGPTAAGPRDHVVHFYDDEFELARTVGGYLRDAAAAGAVAIVIATDPHRQAFEAESASAGIDPLEACDNGTLVLLDASTTMASFLQAGRVDADAFHAEVRFGHASGRRHGKAGPRLRRDGGPALGGRDVLAAIEVEQLWNDLRRELDFSLLCAYRSASVQGDEHAQALQQVCISTRPSCPEPRVTAITQRVRQWPRSRPVFRPPVTRRGPHATS